VSLIDKTQITHEEKQTFAADNSTCHLQIIPELDQCLSEDVLTMSGW